MRATSLPATFMLAAATASAGETSPPPAKAPRFDVASIDRSVDPCADFYRFACGAWIRSNPIPADESRWGRFNELLDANREVLRGILEKASVDDPARDPDTRRIGDYYASCMDE